MPKEKKTANKGLSDAELIAKYEAGKVDMAKRVKTMLKQEPVSPKSQKQVSAKKR